MGAGAAAEPVLLLIASTLSITPRYDSRSFMKSNPEGFDGKDGGMGVATGDSFSRFMTWYAGSGALYSVCLYSKCLYSTCLNGA